MELLKKKTIKTALIALKLKLDRKDIVADEMNEEHGLKNNQSPDFHTKKSEVSKTDSRFRDGVILNKNGKKIEYLNFKYSKKIDTNHFLWDCNNLTYCYQCRLQHFPYGPECALRDANIFNYEKYLEIKNKKENKIVPYSTHKTGGKKKVVSDSSTPSLPSGYKVSSSTEIKQLMMQNIVNNQKIALLKCKENQASASKVLNVPSTLLLDSGANESYLNSKLMVLIRMDPEAMTKEIVQIASGPPVEIKGRGCILDHVAKYIPEFHMSLLSVYQTLKSTDSIAL